MFLSVPVYYGIMKNENLFILRRILYNLDKSIHMPHGVFLINGSGLPYHVIDTAIDWARQNHASLLGIFLFNAERRSESYEFPSDIEQVETRVSEEEGESDLEKLIVNNMQYVQNQANREKVNLETFSIKNPEAAQILEGAKKGEVLFADPNTFKGSDEYAATAFSFEEIAAMSPKVIEVKQESFD